jgi:predicted secreted hydrolase
VIRLPADHYLHPGAPTEWWWHMGTLKAGDRIFGFEINAASFSVMAFTQIMLTDVSNKAHYKLTKVYAPFPADWAEADPAKPWYVKLGDPSTDASFVTMNAPQSDPSKDMAVEAALADETTGTIVKFSLKFSQEGPPFIVKGSGVSPYPPVDGGVKKNNYYYSLTRLQASGTVTIGNTEPIAVEGVTWMDHEYGLFGSDAHPVKWFLQDMQLDNGVHISHFTVFSDAAPPSLGVAFPSQATVQFADGTTYYDKSCTLTPTGRTWTSPRGVLFYLEFKINIPSFAANFTVTSLLDDQDFPFPGGLADTYEGVAVASGKFMGHDVHGTAWNEQQP